MIQQHYYYYYAITSLTRFHRITHTSIHLFDLFCGAILKKSTVRTTPKTLNTSQKFLISHIIIPHYEEKHEGLFLKNLISTSPISNNSPISKVVETLKFMRKLKKGRPLQISNFNSPISPISPISNFHLKPFHFESFILKA